MTCSSLSDRRLYQFETEIKLETNATKGVMLQWILTCVRLPYSESGRKKSPAQQSLCGAKGSTEGCKFRALESERPNVPRIPIWNPMLLVILKAYHSKYCECELILKEGKWFCRVKMYRWGEMNQAKIKN